MNRVAECCVVMWWASSSRLVTSVWYANLAWSTYFCWPSLCSPGWVGQHQSVMRFCFVWGFFCCCFLCVCVFFLGLAGCFVFVIVLKIFVSLLNILCVYHFWTCLTGLSLTFGLFALLWIVLWLGFGELLLLRLLTSSSLLCWP